MSDVPLPSPILKGRQSTSKLPNKRLSVTFFDSNTSPENVRSSPRTATPSSSSSAVVPVSDRPDAPVTGATQHTSYGLCYVPPAAPAHKPTTETSLPVGAKLVFTRSCQRPEINLCARNLSKDRHILIVGDVIHGRNLKKELQTQSVCKVVVTVEASVTTDNVKKADFILLLLPLEMISSCTKVAKTLQQLRLLRADYQLYCAVVGVATARSRDRHTTELYNIHSLVMQYRLSYYYWCDAAPGSWAGIVERLVLELLSCRGETPASRAVLTVLLWPTDSNSLLLQQYLDSTVLRSSQHAGV